MKLEKGEIECPECHGNSWIHKSIKEKGIIYTGMCLKCRGEGKIDWADNLTNKKLYVKCNSFIIKNLELFHSVNLNIHLKIKPHKYMFYSFSEYCNSTNIFDLANICDLLKEKKVIVFENPSFSLSRANSKYNEMLQRVMYGMVVTGE